MDWHESGISPWSWQVLLSYLDCEFEVDHTTIVSPCQMKDTNGEHSPWYTDDSSLYPHFQPPSKHVLLVNVTWPGIEILEECVTYQWLMLYLPFVEQKTTINRTMHYLSNLSQYLDPPETLQRHGNSLFIFICKLRKRLKIIVISSN